MHELFQGGSQNFAIYISNRLPADFGKDNIEKLADFPWQCCRIVQKIESQPPTFSNTHSWLDEGEVYRLLS